MALLSGQYDEPQMLVLAKQLARLLRAGDCLTFQGDLGAGKTTFIRAMIHALCGSETVPSPTFTLVQTYDSSVGSLWHFDLYRLKHAQELYELGIEEALSGGILFIEWPERAKGLLPSTQLQLHLESAQEHSKRKLTISGDAQWAARLTSLNQH
jgi:tRNA threonylcarbamoyladenosine biosynthesis protein TsaE